MALIDSTGTSLYRTACVASPGYVYDSEAYFCYKVHTDMVMWEEARDVCHSEGGELAKVDTPAKLSVIYDIVEKDGSREYFLGARDSDKDGEWRWVSDNSLVEGFDKKGSTECLEIESDLTFDDTGCRNQDQRYFCELLLP
ncbi:C-type lectin domain family 5 member A-like [Haliotis asinina]|uniref:C-type lectin domain family 5 member A-like n=1 Tax=Haliotis asinina TaxID=109174 RepID=UPI00353273A3